MNKTKLKVYKNVLDQVFEKFERSTEFIKEKIKEICFQRKLSVREVTYFVYERLRLILAFN